MAEEEGFEPPIPFRVRQFSRLEPSTTRPLFLINPLSVVRLSFVRQIPAGKRAYPVPALSRTPVPGFYVRFHSLPLDLSVAFWP
jgi:hypothetical protein